MRVRYLKVSEKAKWNLENYPNFASNGSIKGMKEQVYGKNALLVRSGSYIYNVTLNPEIYNNAK